MRYKKPKYRSATCDDLDVCVKLFDSPEFYDADGEKWSKEGLYRYVVDGYFLVAEIEGRVIGCIFGEKIRDKGAIAWLLAVDPGFRDVGIGSGLLKKFENNMKKHKAKWVILYSDIRNSKTLEFYKKNGYHTGDKFVECLKNL